MVRRAGRFGASWHWLCRDFGLPASRQAAPDVGSHWGGRCYAPAPHGVRPWSRQRRVHPGRSASLVRSVLRPTALRCSVLRPRRGTRCVRCALYAQTAATSQLTSRAAREAASPGLAGRAEPVAQPLPRHKQSTGLFVSGARLLGAPEARCSLGARAFAGTVLVFGCLEPGRPNTTSAASRQALPGGGSLWGAEERSPGVGARSALRQHSHRGCPSAESAANAASSAMRPLGEHRRAVDAFSGDRPSVSPRRAAAGAARGG